MLIWVRCLFSVLMLLATSEGHAEEHVALESSVKLKAEQGDLQGQLAYGKHLLKRSYEEGDGVREEAIKWIKMAAARGSPEAIFYLGDSMIGDKSPSYYYEEAARAGYVPAFNYVLDDLLFCGGADVCKAKEFADLARKMKIESEIERNLEVVDICFKAGMPERRPNGAMHSGLVFEDCEHLKDRPDEYVRYVFQHGDNIDVATLYANGMCVPQDFWKAISYLSLGVSIPNELTSMVLTLHDAVQRGALLKEFDYCDHGIGHHISYVLFSREYQAVRKKLDRIVVTFSTEQRSAFDALQKAAYDFFQRRAYREQDLSGTGRGIFVTEMELEQDKWFLATLEALEKQSLQMPAESSHWMNQEMCRLRDVLIEKVTRVDDDGILSFITLENVTEAQGEFSAFREKFSQLVSLRYKDIDLDRFKAFLTQVRVNQLRDLLNYLGDD